MLLLICNRELMFILSEKHRQDNAPQGCTTILIGIMSTELTRIVCQILAEQDLIIRERMKTIWRNQQRLMKKEYNIHEVLHAARLCSGADRTSREESKESSLWQKQQSN